MKRILLTVLVSYFALMLSAQTEISSNTAYSRYGFGMMHDQSLASGKGMAGLSYGVRDGRELNAGNPASYSAIDSLSFLLDFGVSVQQGTFSAGGKRSSFYNGGFDYFAMGFRAGKGLGISLGVIPVTSVGYELKSQGDQIDNGLSGLVQPTTTYSGDGGLNVAYIGLGYRPFKPISIGVNFGYLWGKTTNLATTVFSNNDIQKLARTYYTDIRTYKLDFGVQYEQRIGTRNRFVLGLTYGLGHDINSDAYFFSQSLNPTTLAVSGDTITCHNAFQWPHQFGVGLTWEYRDRWRFGVDYTMQKWSDVRFPTYIHDNSNIGYVSRKGSFDDVNRLNFGFEYQPNPYGLRKRDRIRYRAGFAYTTSYAKVGQDKGPTSYLASLGVGLPIINLFNNRCLVNVAAQYEHLSPSMPGQITENYIRLSIGISFNERWFMKWKVE